MSFNKLRIFNMTEYRKILFIDADVLILRNVDHIMHEPDFTAAFTTECCNMGCVAPAEWAVASHVRPRRRGAASAAAFGVGVGRKRRRERGGDSPLRVREALN